ncbi:MAG TPA: thioredoxin family protein [Bacillota bacterium]|nr:thioredoxin family protein [Bacillota bacterium]HOH09534.1 thioredoxin family protein [Bacillota bacterium]HOS49984.1 thioredoxin family protein [Bacillota bacterium]HQJ24835.1 thioredoxin family protein [Bacillota bacterium]
MKRSKIMVAVLVLLVTAAVVVGAVLLSKPKAAEKSIPEATPEDVTKAASSGRPFVVKMTGENCEACELLEPILAELANELKGKVDFMAIDVYKYPKLAAEHRIIYIPTLIYFDASGQKLGITQGLLQIDQLKDKMKELGII